MAWMSDYEQIVQTETLGTADEQTIGGQNPQSHIKNSFATNLCYDIQFLQLLQDISEYIRR